MDLDWLEHPVLGPDILVKHMLIAAGILFIGVILAIFIPRFISKKVRDLFVNIQLKAVRKRKGKLDIETEREHVKRRLSSSLEKPLRRSLSILILLLTMLFAVFFMNIGLDTRLQVMEHGYEAGQFLQMSIVLGLVTIFVILAVDPILRALVYSLMGDSYSRSRKYGLTKSLRFSTKFILLALTFYLALISTFDRIQLQPFGWLMDLLVFTLILSFSFLIAQLFVVLSEPSFKGKDRTTRNAGRAVGRMIKLIIYLLGGLLGLTILGLDPVTIATSLGLIGFALAFGLQDTVANFAAGILIALDKPFIIGDRIRIDWGGNETWGDVTDISLRSTWIKTPEDEMIVIPNHVIASSQVWNYTRDSPKVAIHRDVSISYDSDWHLAEKLILSILNKHPLVMNTPHPYVLMKEFGESSQVLTIWFWIPEARDKLNIQSDILKKIKDTFDMNGVEIPYPYRTIVYKADIPRPKVLGEDYQSPVFLPSTGFKEFKVSNGKAVDMGVGRSVVLAPTSSSYPARYTAPYVMDTARNMGASVSALFIRTPGSNLVEGKNALRIYNEVAKAYGVDIKLLFKEGDILENILVAVEQEGASIVIMGSTEETLFRSLTKRSISQELLEHLNIPTMIIPPARGRDKIVHEPELQYDESKVNLSSIKSLESLDAIGGGKGSMDRSFES